MISYLIGLLITGLLVGALARLALPGRDPRSILQTIAIGVAGSFGAGLLLYAITGGKARGAGILLSVLVASGIVYLVRRSRGGSLTSPGAVDGRR